MTLKKENFVAGFFLRFFCQIREHSERRKRSCFWSQGSLKIGNNTYVHSAGGAPKTDGIHKDVGVPQTSTFLGHFFFVVLGVPDN